MDKSSSKKSAPLVASNQEPAMSEEERKLRERFPQVYEVIGKAKMYEQQPIDWKRKIQLYENHSLTLTANKSELSTLGQQITFTAQYTNNSSKTHYIYDTYGVVPHGLSQTVLRAFDASPYWIESGRGFGQCGTGMMKHYVEIAAGSTFSFDITTTVSLKPEEPQDAGFGHLLGESSEHVLLRPHPIESEVLPLHRKGDFDFFVVLPEPVREKGNNDMLTTKLIVSTPCKVNIDIKK